MGARTQVKIISSVGQEPPVYLYAHWGAGGPTLEAVRRALAREQRWNDSEYLARIIFSEMIKGDIDRETGYGIGTTMHGDLEELIIVDCPKQKLRYGYFEYSQGVQEAFEHFDNRRFLKEMHSIPFKHVKNTLNNENTEN